MFTEYAHNTQSMNRTNDQREIIILHPRWRKIAPRPLSAVDLYLTFFKSKIEKFNQTE